MIDPSIESTEVSPQERKARFLEIADGIQLQYPEQFNTVGIDYSKHWRNFIEELRAIMKRNLNDVVVLIQFGSWQEFGSVRNLNPEGTEMFLGKRLPGRIYGGTWAPIMGKIEEEDLEGEMVKDFPNMTFGEFISLVPAWREEQEEKKFESVTPSTILARPYLDEKSGRIVHVVLKSYTEIPELLDKKSSEPSRPDSEHSEVRWFKLDGLPLQEMDGGTKQAVKNALVKLAEIQQ